ncbi:hypothetical protein AQUCO_01400653v1 [Aquilegia coerulea]|uniref:Uncharacterized protein n=1 Tax=Aquilegia coerulea TaxID=218851 RepID=A0A2G5DY94_AQUCA|nr:hypothetical protein AQUCO_01400653v1 [Aquilegia coerulea]
MRKPGAQGKEGDKQPPSLTVPKSEAAWKEGDKQLQSLTETENLPELGTQTRGHPTATATGPRSKKISDSGAAKAAKSRFLESLSTRIRSWCSNMCGWVHDECACC